MENNEANRRDATPAEFNLADLFAGVGGLTLGFLDSSGEPGARFVPRLMVDIDREARYVVKRNLPGVPYLVADVHKLSGADVRRYARLGPREPLQVLVGSSLPRLLMAREAGAR